VVRPGTTAAQRKLAVEAADNVLRGPELAAGITRIKGVKSKGVRVWELAIDAVEHS
jgi:hypothetical protein